MIGMDVDHCQVVSSRLNESAPVNHQVLTSMAVLNERLERVKALGGVFAGISLSSDAQKLNSWAGASMATASS